MAKRVTKKNEQSGRIRVGIAGWKYEPWRGTFYPEGLVQRRELEYASRALPCIEINSTFYRLQQPGTFANWYGETPDDFVFSVKAPKRITHEKRLRDVDESVARFLASGIFELRQKLGPILWQFPPNMPFDATLFEAFLASLPHSVEQANAFVMKHNLRIDAALLDDPSRPLRHAIEVRHASFVDPAFIALLRRYDAAMVVADTGGRWPEFEDACSDFMYLRLHGADELYTSGYSEAALDRWAGRIATWAAGNEPDDAKRISDDPAPKRTRDVFCYFDNTMKEEAPTNARRVLEKLGIAPDPANAFKP